MKETGFESAPIVRQESYARISILGFAVSAAAAAGFVQHKPKPNIVFILAEDLGIDGIGGYGSDRFEGKTPNLDPLAKGGIRFERGYSMPLCGPSRCCRVTGRYGFRTGGLSNSSRTCRRQRTKSASRNSPSRTAA